MSATCCRATVDDGAAFSALINGLGGQSLYRALYGQYNFTSLVEYSYLTISAKNEEDVLGGFLSFNDALTGDAEPFDEFLNRVSSAAPGCSVLNSLVVNFFAYSAKICGPLVGKTMLREAFARCPDVNNVFWLCPSNAKAPPFIASFFVQVPVDDPSETFQKNKLFMIRRDDFLPELLVREARVEDNDDLLPILQTSNPGIMYGQDDFFLADMIQSQNERNKIFVGVSDEKPVGMLATSLDVNAALISRVFDLELFSGLVSGGADLARQTQLMVLVLGESSVVTSCNFKELSTSMGGNFLDVSSLGDEPGADTILDQLSAMPLAAAAFCIVVGYPKTEGAAKDFVNMLSVQEQRLVIFEVQATTLEPDDVDAPEQLGVDDGEELLLDAIEYLRGHLVNGDNDDDAMRAVPNVDWVKVDITENMEAAANGTPQVEKKMLEIVELHKWNLAECGDEMDDKIVANAFAITLFCIEEGYESRSQDMLRVAFEENPLLDYCLLMLPNGIGSLAITSCMSNPRVRPGVSFDQTLFLAHRDQLLAGSFLKLERFTSEQQAHFEDFVGNMKSSESAGLVAAFHHSLKESDVSLIDNPSEACFVATIQGVVVGAISISRRVTTTDDIVRMRQNYLIESVVYFERHRSRSQAMITHWVMNPIFSKSARFILREVMRQYQKTLLYYECRAGGVPCPEALFEMIPVRPRIYTKSAQIESHPEEPIADSIDEDKSSASLNPADAVKRDTPLFVMSKMELSSSKILISKRIVVIGGNSSAFSILETLCYSRDIFLSTIYFVTELDNFRLCGYPSSSEEVSDDNNLRGSLSVRDIGDPTRSYLNALGIANRVIMVSGRLTDIDRKSKAVVISDDIALEYDVLIIAAASQDASFKNISALSGYHPVANVERGVFGLGSQIADAAAENWIVAGGGKADCEKILVCGTSENALVAMGRLLSIGISPNRLVWLSPFVGDNVFELGHSDVNESAENAFHGLNIGVYQGVIESVDLSDENGTVMGVLIRRMRLDTDVMSLTSGEAEANPTVSTVEITSETEAKEFVSCKTILLCNNPNNCDIDLFAAVKDCGLVFDGGVVVDKSFRTVDEHIYAVGNFTKYSRRYRNAPRHTSFNARELGIYVANEVMRNQLNVASVGKDESSFPFDLNEFLSPKIVEISLPGGLCYYKSTIPDQYPMAYRSESLRALITRCVDPENVSVLKFDPLGVVVEMIYIGVEPMENLQLGRLVGFHEALLNSAVYCFEKALIKDWLTFFRGNWVTAVLHEEFETVRQNLSDPINGEKYVLSLMDSLSEKVMTGVSDEDIVKASSQILGDRCAFVPESVTSTIEAPVMDFVKKYKSDFPRMYIPIPHNSRNSKK